MGSALSFGLVARAVFLVVGCVWCREVALRFRRDLTELRGEGEREGKIAIVLVWLATVAILAWMPGALATVVSSFVPRF